MTFEFDLRIHLNFLKKNSQHLKSNAIINYGAVCILSNTTFTCRVCNIDIFSTVFIGFRIISHFFLNVLLEIAAKSNLSMTNNFMEAKTNEKLK